MTASAKHKKIARQIDRLWEIAEHLPKGDPGRLVREAAIKGLMNQQRPAFLQALRDAGFAHIEIIEDCIMAKRTSGRWKEVKDLEHEYFGVDAPFPDEWIKEGELPL